MQGGFPLCGLLVVMAGCIAGTARFGFQGMAQHALSIGSGVFLVSFIVLLVGLDSAHAFGASLLLVFASFPLAVVFSHGVTWVSRIVHRNRPVTRLD
jgi:hypothetical protein